MKFRTLQDYFRGYTRLLYIKSDEEYVTLRRISALNKAAQAAGQNKGYDQVAIYSPVLGVRTLDDYIAEWTANMETADSPTLSPTSAFSHIYKDKADKRKLYIILDSDTWFSPNGDFLIKRRIKNIIAQINENPKCKKTIYFVGSSVQIPEAMRSQIEYVEDEPLSEAEVTQLSRALCERLKLQQIKDPVRLFAGLSQHQIKSLFVRQISATKPTGVFNEEVLRDFRQQAIKQAGGLIQIVDNPKTFAEIGGLDRFKAWVKSVAPTWTEEGRAFGLEPPRGVLSLGIWGCGKSASVQAMASEWGMPLVSFEMGKLRSGLVGGSEQNLYRTLAIIEKISPCVLWVDEAEKGLSGSASSNATDGGVGLRMLGILSTWIQETSAQVCLALTANRVKTLPVEFINRLNERFFVDVPGEDERMDIIDIHLKKNKQVGKFNLKRLAQASDRLVPREIEQGIKAAMIASFTAKKKGLDEDLLAAEFTSRPRLLDSMEKEVQEVQEWICYDPDLDEGRKARLASSRKKKTEIQRV